MRQTKINVQFRLDPDLFAILEQRARAANTTPGPFARLMVISALSTEANQEQLAAMLSSQNHTLDEIRRDIRVSVAALLIAAGKKDPTAAREWVQENLPRP